MKHEKLLLRLAGGSALFSLLLIHGCIMQMNDSPSCKLAAAAAVWIVISIIITVIHAHRD